MATPPNPSASPAQVDGPSRRRSTATAMRAVNSGCSAPMSAITPAGNPRDMAHQLGPT